MAIRFVFHWGPTSHLDRLDEDNTSMFSIWPYHGKFEELKRCPHNPAIGVVMTSLSSTVSSYRLLLELCQVSRMRYDDPTYKLPDHYVPTSIQELHVWCEKDTFLPWEQNATKSKVWNMNPPQCLAGIPYHVVYHGTPDQPHPIPLKERRRLYTLTKYKPKIFVPV